MLNLTEQAYEQLKKISAHAGIKCDDMVVTQMEPSTIYFKALKFGQLVRFTVERTKTGKVKKGSVRFYEPAETF